MSGAGATYQSLISPRSRVPIVLADDQHTDTIHVPEIENGILLPLAGGIRNDEDELVQSRLGHNYSNKIQEVQGRSRPKSSIGFSNRNFDESDKQEDLSFDTSRFHHHQAENPLYTFTGGDRVCPLNFICKYYSLHAFA